MPEREVEWYFTGPSVRMGDSDYLVHSEAHVVGVDTTTGAPDLEARFEVRDGVPECVEFTLRAKPKGRAVRSADLRLFDLDGFTLNTFTRRGAITKKPADQRSGPAAPITDEREWWSANAAVADAQHRRQSVSRYELEEVARIYLENINGRPTQAVEQGMGYSSARTAARRVKQAEEAGLLPATSRGRKRRAGA